MNFVSWKENDVLSVNEFGILEPIKNKVKTPNLILVQVLIKINID